MRRTKIKTDNVEQLMEIVRSLQRGEEPTQESIRESAERVSKTDAPMSDEPMSDEPESDAQTGEKRTDTEADWDAEDDAFDLWRRPMPVSVRDGSDLRKRKSSRRAAEGLEGSGRRRPAIWKAGGHSRSLKKTTITKTQRKKHFL